VLAVAGPSVLDDRDHLSRARGLAAFEALQAGIHASPSRADQIDEEREVVHAGVSLREQLALEPLETPYRLVEQASDLCDVTSDRKDFGAKTVADGDADLCRNRRLQLGGRRGQRLDLGPRTFECGLEPGGLRPAGRGLGDSLLGPFQSEFVHGRRGYSPRRMDTALLEYELPPELIAQRPAERRDASRLLVYRRETGAIEHRVFSELPDLLADELVVVNDTRVVPARLLLQRASGGRVEVLLVEQVAPDGLWEGLARPGGRLRAGERLGPVELVEPLGDGRWLLRLEGEPAGEAPLPPYIHEPLADPERYQTVFAEASGSAAAPTAGLHFTRELLARLDPATITLHVGLDTFRPVSSVTLEDHPLHGERYSVAPPAWKRISEAERVLAVGTTTVRALETVARTGELSGRTTLFITPGFAFRRVDALLTNFHLPRSTLLALVMAFAGVEETRELYRCAVAERYRFYSFGDAMLVF
jgi:S-adenosylmethionine:tRNA ribosyltransferase-isomerase